MRPNLTGFQIQVKRYDNRHRQGPNGLEAGANPNTPQQQFPPSSIGFPDGDVPARDRVGDFPFPGPRIPTPDNDSNPGHSFPYYPTERRRPPGVVDPDFDRHY
jgi:hypothetical protein